MKIGNKMDGFNDNINLANSSIIRISTGINKLDTLLSGGLPNNSITLVSGSPGSGKTILCYHYLWEGLNSGEKCLFITSDERISNVLKQAKELGFDFNSWIEADKIKFIYLDLDNSSIYKEIEEEIRSRNYSRIVLDSITPVSEVPVWASGIHEIIPSDYSSQSKKYPIGSIPATRMHVRRIMSIFGQNNCTALITSEVSGDTCTFSRDTISEFLADGIIYLDLDTTMDRRKLTIRKMRSTKHTLKPQDIVITEGGIKFV
jgi:circadian clock protein KaiC